MLTLLRTLVASSRKVGLGIGLATLLVVSACAETAPTESANLDNDQAGSSESGGSESDLLDRGVQFVFPTQATASWAAMLTVCSEGGPFDQAGSSCELEAASGSAAGLQQVVAGRSDVAIGAPTDIAKANAEQSTTLVAFGTLKPAIPYTIVSSPDDPMESAQDMVGKTIGVASLGGSTDQMLDIFLEKNGVDPDSVAREVVSITPASFELVKAGDIAGVFYNETATAAIRAGGERYTSLYLKDEIPMPGLVMAARKDSIEQAPEVYTKIVELVQEGYQTLVDSAPEYEDALSLLQELIPDLDPETAKASIDGDVEDYLAFGDRVEVGNDEAAWNEGYETMRQGKYLGDALPPKEDIFILLP